jgi:hypothetical protein
MGDTRSLDPHQLPGLFPKPAVTTSPIPIAHFCIPDDLSERDQPFHAPEVFGLRGRGCRCDVPCTSYVISRPKCGGSLLIRWGKPHDAH